MTRRAPRPVAGVSVRASCLVGVLLGAAFSLGIGSAAPVGAATWAWPLPGPPAVVRPFLPPATPYGPGHRGVDLAAPPGATVLAAGAGVVGYAGPLAGRGVVTVLHDGGLRTTYEPVTALVRSGQPVGLGQPLGQLVAGHPGCPTAACLHWGLIRGETYLDPLSLLGFGRVRLLPLSGRPAGPATRPQVAVRVDLGPRPGQRAGWRPPGTAGPAAAATVAVVAAVTALAALSPAVRGRRRAVRARVGPPGRFTRPVHWLEGGWSDG